MKIVYALMLSVLMFFCIHVPQTVFAGNNLPLRSLVTYENFISLTQYNLQRVKELKPIWTECKNKGIKNLYLGGGVLRGLLHWQYLSLQSHTIQEVMGLEVPRLSQFQLPGGKDIDFFGPEDLPDTLMNKLSRIREVDFITLSRHSDFVKLGGATIEKTGANPFSILDPLDGIRDYYNGEMVFSWPTKAEFKKLSHESDNDFTLLAEALRFLRFGYFNLPEAKPTTESLQLIQKISLLESHTFTNEGRVAWLETTLEKLFYSSGNQIETLLDLLHQNNLLWLIAKIRVMAADNIISAAKVWFEKNKSRFSQKERSTLNSYFTFTSCADIAAQIKRH